jgi:5,6-dimethylbenzimidazole synthase
VLGAAHAAPSVGLSQPWDFVVIEDLGGPPGLPRARRRPSGPCSPTRSPPLSERFADIKIEGILESTLSVVVTYDPARGAPSVLGRHAIADAGLYSVCLAIENLWLAATAEGMGVGWVSFYREEFVADLVGLPGRASGRVAVPRPGDPSGGGAGPRAPRLAEPAPPLRGAPPRPLVIRRARLGRARSILGP